MAWTSTPTRWLLPRWRQISCHLAPTAGKAGNNNLVDGAGGSTQTSTFVTPQYTSGAGANVSTSATGSCLPSNATCTVGEVLYFLEAGASSFARLTRRAGTSACAEARCRTTFQWMRCSCVSGRICTTSCRDTMQSHSDSARNFKQVLDLEEKLECRFNR
jgi:hypothetical protein